MRGAPSSVIGQEDIASKYASYLCQCCGSATWSSSRTTYAHTKNIYRVIGQKDKREGDVDFLIMDKDVPGPFYLRWRNE